MFQWKILIHHTQLQQKRAGHALQPLHHTQSRCPETKPLDSLQTRTSRTAPGQRHASQRQMLHTASSAHNRGSAGRTLTFTKQMPGVAAANTRHFMRKSPDFQE